MNRSIWVAASRRYLMRGLDHAGGLLVVVALLRLVDLQDLLADFAEVRVRHFNQVLLLG